MIVKNPSTSYGFINHMIPRWSVDGYQYVEAIAFEATTANMPGALCLSASGYVFDGFQTHAATGTTKVVICMDAVGSGELVKCALQGYIPNVNISGTGTVTTAYSTFTVGHAVKITDTGHLLDVGASWVEGDWTASTVAAEIGGILGIAMSSGETAVVDLMMFEKKHYYCIAT